MPANRGKYVSHPEISKLVKKVFGDKTESVERAEFFQLYVDNKSVKETFLYFTSSFQNNVKMIK